MQLSRIHVSAIVMIVFGSGALSATADKVYWTELTGQRVMRANPDGTDHELLVLTGSDQPVAIALDVPGGKMYWTFMGEIQRASLNGTNVESLVIGPPTAKGLALDVTGGKMYWTGADPTGRILRSNLDGTDVETVIEKNALWLALDVANATIYWTTAGAVIRAGFDGRNMETLVQATPGIAFEAIALDLTHGKMYWVESGAQRIRWANLDGSDAADCITGLGAPVGIAWDGYHEKIYWTDNGAILRADLDCTNIETDVVTGLSWPAGVALQIDCDNGVVDPGETCDIAIPEGSPGACPTSCDDADPCTTDTLVDAGSCTTRCEFPPVTTPINDDGCCPAGANANNDNDCDPVCGNDICEPGEDDSNCPEDCTLPIPALSQWGLLSLGLLLLAGAKIHFRRRRVGRPIPRTR